MEKIDIKKQLKEYYNPRAKEVSLVDVPTMKFLTITGEGAPESPQFKEAIEALYPIAYGIKFYYKKGQAIDYGVMPLEGLWWADDMTNFNQESQNKDLWKWQLMIAQPDFVTKEVFEQVRDKALDKKKNPNFNQVRFEEFTEGPSTQIMHIGPFATEKDNIQKLHQTIEELGAKRSGMHHEIYLNDFRKISPEKMKTVLRQPYSK